MRKLRAFAVLLVLAGVVACGAGYDAANSPDAVYVDVRTPAEYAEGHVDGAILIPVDELESRIAELEPYRDREVALYCRTGNRSATALRILQDNGFTAAHNAGSFTGLARQGLPTATGAPRN